MGGQLVQHKPVAHEMLLQNPQTIHAFSLCGWLNYFLSLNDFDEEAVGEFLRTLSEGEATIWVLTVVATENRIAEVIGLLAVGKNFSFYAAAAKAEFSMPTDGPLEVSKQGCRHVSLPPPYSEYAIYIIRYLTCEGHFSYLHSHHFKLLSHMRHGLVINVLNFLLKFLEQSAHGTQQGKDNFVAHHGLIKLLIERSLRDVSPLSWQQFVAQKSLLIPQPPRVLTPWPQKKKKEIASTSKTGQGSSTPVAPGPAAFAPKSSARIQTRSTTRKEKGKTKAKGSPKYDPRSQKRQCPSPATPSPTTVSSTATPIAISSSLSSSGRAKPFEQTRKRKATETPPAAASVPRRVSARKQSKTSPVLLQPEVIVILEGSVESKFNVS